MLRLFRASGKTSGTKLIVWIVLGLVVAGLIGFNLVDAARGLSGQNVATVGNATVSSAAYQRALTTAVDNLSRQFNAPFTVSQARSFGLDRQILGQLVTQAALDAEAERLGVSVGDITVRDAIVERPEFQSPAGGFDTSAYEFVLQRSGLTAPEYEDRIRKDVTRSLLEAGVGGGVVMPRLMAETLLRHEGEARGFDYVVLTLETLQDPLPDPTEDDLRAFHDDNPDAYTLPETRRITYVKLSPDDLAATIEIPETVLRAAYDAAGQRFDTPERRVIDRIVFRTTEEAADQMARIEAGETIFDALGASRGLTPEDMDQGEVRAADLSPQAAQAVFGVTEPGIVGPVDTDLGPALFRINAILAARTVAFEEARDTLRDELAADSAADAVGREIEAVQDLIAGGATLEEIAAETPLTLGTTEISERTGEGLAADPAVREAALAAEPGLATDLFDLNDGGIAALRVDEIVPPALQPFDTVRDAVASDWRVVAQQAALAAYGESLRARAAEGRTFASVAADAGLTPVTAPPMRRDAASGGVPPSVRDAVFGLPAGGVAVVEDITGVHVVALTQIVAYDPQAEANAAEIAARRDALSNAAAQDLFSGYAQALQSSLGVRINQPLIDQILAQYP